MMAAQPYPGAAPPPPGVTPNLADPRDAGRTLNFAVMGTVNVLVIIFLSIRLAAKFYINRQFLVEDATCIAGAALILLYSATIIVTTYYGMGYHQWEISQRNYDQVLKWLYASSVVYIPCAFAVKTTLLLLIARVFAVRRKIARAIHIFIWAIAFAYLPIQLCKIFVCTPIRAYWQAGVDGNCLEQRRIFLADLTIAIFTDLAILIIPIPLTWSLSLPWKRKIKIVLLLACGGFATATTVFRLVRAVQFIGSTDVTHDFVALDCLTVTEVAIGFICSCVPSTNLLFQKFWSAAKCWRNRKCLSLQNQINVSPTKHPVPQEKLSNFTTELALWSGVQDEARMSGDPEAAGALARSSLSSREGRREGWLAKPQEMAEVDSKRKISHELSSVSRNEPWDHIWDGGAKR